MRQWAKPGAALPKSAPGEDEAEQMLKRTLMTALAFNGAFASAVYAQGSEPPGASAPEASPNMMGPGASAAETDSDRVAYPAAYFDAFNPQTAYDMIARTPGFTLNGGDDRRGFSGAVGNLLIDGVRPTAKNQSLRSILSRIPASQVVRIEVLRGAATAGDASGQSVLANVVRTPSAGDGIWEAGFDWTPRHRPAPNLEASWSGRDGAINYGLGASYFGTFRNVVGARRLYDTPGGEEQNAMLTQTREEASPRHFEEYAANGDFAAPLFNGQMSVNAEVSGFRFHADSSTDGRAPDGAPLFEDVNPYQEEELVYELGGNYERDFGPWTMNLIGLATRRYYASDESLTRSGANGFVSAQSIRRDSSETIGRGSLARDFEGGHHFEFGYEGAINTLDAGLRLPGQNDIPNANVDVREERAEAYTSHAWRFAPRWSVESRLAYETSTLSFTGDADQETELSFWKPSIQLSRDIGERSQARVRLYRNVGQLDFDDFVSSVAISDERLSGGNPDLQPETSWLLELAGDLRLAGDLTISLAYTRGWYEDVADVVPIVDPANLATRFDAPGNIGDGNAQSLSLDITAPLTRFIPGGRLTIEADISDSEVTDPVTNARREASNDPEFELDVEFRQDLSELKFAWGVSYYREHQAAVYRLNEVLYYEEGPWIDLFVESTHIPGVKLRFEVINSADGTILRDRYFYEPDRTGALDSFESRTRSFEGGAWFAFSASGTF